MKSIIKELLNWLLFIFVVVAVSWAIVTFVGQRTQERFVHGDDALRWRPAYRG